MKKIFAASVALLMIFFTGCGDESKGDRVLVIGVDNFAPMGFHDAQGNFVGFDVDMAKEAAKRMGVEPEFKIIDWNEKEHEINSGRVDMIWNGLNITGNRDQYMLFSRPYMDNRQILMVKHGNPRGIHALGDLENKIVATQAGSNSETYINEDDALRETFAAFETYRTISEGFDGLNSGKFDALIIDEIAARYEIIQKPGAFEIVEVTIGSSTKFGIGFPKDKTELRDEVQKVFSDMIKDGTAKKISLKWFGADLIKSGR